MIGKGSIQSMIDKDGIVYMIGKGSIKSMIEKDGIAYNAFTVYVCVQTRLQ